MAREQMNGGCGTRGWQAEASRPNTAMPVPLHLIYSCFHGSVAELISCHRDLRAKRAQNSYCLFLSRKSLPPLDMEESPHSSVHGRHLKISGTLWLWPLSYFLCPAPHIVSNNCTEWKEKIVFLFLMWEGYSYATKKSQTTFIKVRVSSLS